MGFFQRLRAAVARSPTSTQVKMVTEAGNGLYSYDGNLYKSLAVSLSLCGDYLEG